jgi:pyridoxamine 5'-phosphate oxidase
MGPEELDPDPIAQFRVWLDDASTLSQGAASMTLATSTLAGRPSVRIVLLRGLEERGFVFFTNRESRKGNELEQNPHAALLFHWWELGRQVRVEGPVEEIAQTESETYWRSRPPRSRLAAWASPQSRPLASRQALEKAFESAQSRFAGDEIPLPPFWGGYRVLPESIEFWLHRDDRLHDRVRYRQASGGWVRERLAP